MKSRLVVAFALAACAVMLVLWIAVRAPGSADISPSVQADTPAEVRDLEAEIARLRAELARMQRDPDRGSTASVALEVPLVLEAPAPVASDRSPAAPPIAADAHAYLDEYVASVHAGAESEYYRLLVAACVVELLPRISSLVQEPTAHLVLRVRLIEILGDRRLRGRSIAMDALVGLLRPELDERVIARALSSLKSIGDARAVAGIERSIWSLKSAALRRSAIDVIALIAGPRVHESLHRLLASAPDDAMRAVLLSQLDPERPIGALAVFELASTLEQNVRLQAARKIGAFWDPAVVSFIPRWLSFETDRAVRALLENARAQAGAIPSWHARQAIGPPDANPRQDDPKAWASADDDMGEQWIELGYTPARRCHTVRIFEVNSAGAVVAVIAIEETGAEHALWSGVDPTQAPGVFEIRVPSTSYPVRRLRVVLDTDLRPGWNEIDCVELSGPDGSAWASEARASSSYAGG